MSFDRDTWQTPDWLFNAAQVLLGKKFTLDACADDKNHRCPNYYTKEQDGFQQSWQGHTVFCNPPYSKGNIEACLKKAHAERYQTKGIALILPFDICAWGREYLWDKEGIAIFVLDKRIKFVNPVTGKDEGSPRGGTMLILFDSVWGKMFNMINVEDLKVYKSQSEIIKHV